MKQEPATDHGRISLRVALIGNLLALANSASILLIDAPGSEIRPMHLPIFLFMIAISTALLTIPLAISALLQARQRTMGAVAILLSLTPLFVGLLAFIAIVHFFDYKLKD